MGTHGNRHWIKKASVIAKGLDDDIKNLVDCIQSKGSLDAKPVEDVNVEIERLRSQLDDANTVIEHMEFLRMMDEPSQGLQQMDPVIMGWTERIVSSMAIQLILFLLLLLCGFIISYQNEPFIVERTEEDLIDRWKNMVTNMIMGMIVAVSVAMS